MNHRQVFAPLFAAVVLVGCAEDPVVGNDYAQCHGASQRAPLGEGAGAYLPEGIEWNCGTSRPFLVDGRAVTLEYFAYGELNDCLAGCFSSFACVINDGSSSMLYRAGWTSAQERPKGLDALCPSLGAGASDTRSCEASLPARSHAVTQLADFKALVAAESREVFRYCF